MVSIFIDDKKLDLFGDEKITIITKSTDIENLDKVFTDSSFPFTVPATDNNNTIFQHYYDFNLNNTFNVNVRTPVYIEFNSLPYRNGTIQLESVNLRNGVPQSYKITFYGGLKQLTEIFGDDSISELDYTTIGGTYSKVYSTLSDHDFIWNDFNWYSTLYNDNLYSDIITPLILMTNRDIQLGGGGSPNSDITISDNAIKSSETRSAIRLIKIIEGIQLKYGITFSDGFFKSAHFSNLFLWLNNTKEFNYERYDYEVVGVFSGTNTDTNFTYDSPYLNCTRRLIGDHISQQTYTYYLDFRWGVTIPSGYENVPYDIEIVDEDGFVLKTYENNLGSNYFTMYYESNGYEDTPTETRREEVKMRVKPKGTIIMDIDTTVKYYRINYLETNIDWYVNVSNSTNITLNQYFRVDKNITDMKVVEFLQSIMKMFKLVIKPISSTDFFIDTIDVYSKFGDTLNITEYVDTSNIEIEKPTIYSNIDFKYEKSDNILQKKYRQTFDPFNDEIGYGDLSADYEISDKKELKVELPFEIMLFENLNVIGTSSVVGTSSVDEWSNLVIGLSSELDEETNEITERKSKPILFYNNGIVDNIDTPIQVVFDVGTASSYPTSLVYTHLVGNSNDEILNQVSNTITWGAEIDPFHKEVIEDSLYQKYWSNWMESIYSIKQRKIKLTSYLPPILIQKLSLDDRLIIGDNRYRINDYKSDITTGKVDFTLYNDIFKSETVSNIIYPTIINTNCGSKYYGINLNVDSDIEWTVSKTSDGYGTDWIDIITESGSGSGEVTIKVNTKLTQSSPTVFDNRSMYIDISIDGTLHQVLINQRGLPDPT